MTEQPIIKSKPWGSIALFPLFGGIFFCVICVWCLSGAFVNGYPQIFPLIFGILFGVIALLCFGSIYFQGGFFAIFEDRLVVYSYLRTKIKTVLISDILKWNEEIYNDDNKTKSLTVYTANKKYCLSPLLLFVFYNFFICQRLCCHRLLNKPVEYFAPVF
jgi:hypothetical protein